MKPLRNINGITVAELKQLVKDLPEKDDNGEDFEVWIANTDDDFTSNPAKTIMQLNRGDIIFSIK